MAVAFRSSTTAIGSGSGVAGSGPAGRTSGDVFVAMLGTTNSSGTAPDIAAPTGWTKIATGTPSASLPWVRAALYTHVFNGSDPTFTWTDTGSDYSNLIIAAFSGADNTTPVVSGENSQAGYDTTTPAIATITTAAGGMLVGGLFSFATSGYTPPSGMTEAADFDISTMVYETVGAGATGAKTWTLGGADFTSVAGAVLQASGGGGGGGGDAPVPPPSTPRRRALLGVGTKPVRHGSIWAFRDREAA